MTPAGFHDPTHEEEREFRRSSARARRYEDATDAHETQFTKAELDDASLRGEKETIIRREPNL